MALLPVRYAVWHEAAIAAVLTYRPAGPLVEPVDGASVED